MKLNSTTTTTESQDKFTNYMLEENPFSDEDNDQWEPDEEFNELYITMDNEGNATVHGSKDRINAFKKEIFQKLDEISISGIPQDTNVIKIKQC